MGTFSIWHILIIGAIVLILFGGRGKLSDVMGDFAKGIKSFKKGLADEETPPAKTIDADRREEAPARKDTATHS
jgi:sec-independent protein translocase protein TatA